LALALPVGLLRQEDGRVVKDPDVAVQHTLTLVFQMFLARQSVSQVVRRLREQGLWRPRRHRNGETVWRTPTVAAVMAILRNPAYPGTFVYGKTRMQPQPGRARPRQRRLSQAEWKVMVHNRYPASITWETFERIQAILEANYAAYEHNRRRGVPRQGAALLQGIVYCGICGHKMVVQYKGGHQYLCNYLRAQTQAPVCQRLPADPVDQHVVAAFFQALAPVELALYEQAMQQRRQQQDAVERAHQLTLQRLRYEADLARRRYERVDPENRLVADELERRWEAALQALHDAEEHYHRLQQANKVVPLSIPRTLRTAFTSLGTSLPTVWHQDTMSRAQRKALWRCLIDKVVLHRVTRDTIRTRMVWRGGAVSELEVPSTVGTVGSGSFWPLGIACAGVVVPYLLGVVGLVGHAPALTSPLGTVAAAAFPSCRVLLSRRSSVLRPPPTSQVASPWTSARTLSHGFQWMWATDDLRAPLFHRLLSQHSAPLRRGVLRGGASRVFASSMAFAWRERLGSPLSLAGSHHGAAGFTSCDGLLGCTSFSEGYSASAPPVTQEHWEPATWRSGAYHDRTYTG
jgi:hypothetical protein